MITITIIDDHPMVLEGLAKMLNASSKFSVVQSFATVKEAMLGLSIKQSDIVLLDVNLPDGNGILVCKEILTKYPSSKVIGISNFEEVNIIKQMLQKGASGYLLKNVSKQELFKAIDLVVDGEIYLPNALKQKLFNLALGNKRASFIPKISKREKQVLELIVKEFTTNEISEKLFVSVKTVEAHRSHLIQKLGVRNTAGLVRVAIEKGLI